MGNIWQRCCAAENESEHANEVKEQLLLTSALRTPTLPSLASKAELRKESKRTVRIESLSPMIEVEDYETGSEASEEGYRIYDSPPQLGGVRTPANLSPSRIISTVTHQSSGLRRLLATAASRSFTYDDTVEQKEDGDSKTLPAVGLRRVERQNSLQAGLVVDERDPVFASAPVAAMKDTGLPRGLIFGFLDDSAVSRMAFQNTLKHSLFGSEESFVRGATLEEALNFPNEVLKKKADMVVLDQCLDFEVTPGIFRSIKGTDLAREIRQKGFEGCIIMQSEQDSLKEIVDFDIVDGISGKQEETSTFAIARMVALTRRKQKSSNSFFPMPSSTHSSWNSRAESSFSFDMEDPSLRRREGEDET